MAKENLENQVEREGMSYNEVLERGFSKNQNSKLEKLGTHTETLLSIGNYYEKILNRGKNLLREQTKKSVEKRIMGSYLSALDDNFSDYISWNNLKNKVEDYYQSNDDNYNLGKVYAVAGKKFAGRSGYFTNCRFDVYQKEEEAKYYFEKAAKVWDSTYEMDSNWAKTMAAAVGSNGWVNFPRQTFSI